MIQTKLIVKSDHNDEQGSMKYKGQHRKTIK